MERLARKIFAKLIYLLRSDNCIPVYQIDLRYIEIGVTISLTGQFWKNGSYVQIEILMNHNL